MPGQPVVLDTFGGLVTVARAEDIPEGASPRTHDSDFIVGRVVQRPGAQSQYSYADSFFGPNSGGIASNIDTSGAIWGTPENILTSDGNYATVNLFDPVFAVSLNATTTSVGAGVPWSNPDNLDNVSLFASVSLSGNSSQTLAGAMQDLVIHPGATISGIAILFQAEYSGTRPTFNASLNVGSGNPAFTLTTSIQTYGSGGSASLWGYSNWSQATLTDLVVNFNASSTGSTTININNLTVYAITDVSGVSDRLQVTQFEFEVPPTSPIVGIQATVSGFAPAAALSAQLVRNGVAVGSVETVNIPSSLGSMVFGGHTDSWGEAWNPDDINNAGFGIQFFATGLTPMGVSLDFAQIQVFTAETTANFNGLMSYENQQGTQYTLALDSNGLVWQENVSTAPNVLTLASTLPLVTPGAYMKGITVYDYAFLAFSDLTQGVSMPMQFNGQWADRITQVGPAAPPQFSASQSAGAQATISAYSFSSGILTLTTSTQAYTAGELVQFSGFTGALIPLNGLTFSILGTGLTTTQIEIATTLVAGSGSDAGTATPQYTYPIEASPLGIVQPPQMSDPDDAGHFQSLLWSTGPGSQATGNVITVYYSNQFTHVNPDETLVNAFNGGYPVYVYIQNAPFGNGVWQVTSVGSDVPPHGEYARWYFTYQVPTTSFQFFGGPDDAAGTYQQTAATVTTTTPVPNLGPGDQVSLQGVTNSAWDNTYTIIQTVNSGTYAITQTALASGVATYTWALQSGSAPAVGDLVTVTETLNANGILNVTNAVITSATGTTTGTFTVDGFSGTLTFPTAVESGEAVTAGTQFVIDPGAALVNTTSQSPILGNSGGGTLTVVGAAAGNTFPIGPGTRQGVVFFITRNGAVTRPSPPFTFTVQNGANYISASSIPLGPPNVVARGIAFTEAGQNGVPGANFYTYDTPVSFTVNGITYVASALLIPDNVTTSAKFTFSDSVLLSSDAIDIPGNNYFALMEIGNPAWMFQYANRVLCGLCQTKVQNFLNLTFDGGFMPNSGTSPGSTGGTALLPLGWNIDPTYAFASTNTIQLLTSPQFGNSLLLVNNTGSAQGILGMLTQNAFQDAFFAPIIDANTAYSVRVVARTTAGATGVLFNVDLVNSNAGIYGVSLGRFGCEPLDSVFETFTGPLMPATETIPTGLLLRIYLSNATTNCNVEIDRIEIFPTDRPVDTTTIWVSYANNPEAFDENTGSLGVGAENAQPAVGALEILNQLFIEKTGSLQVTQDSPNYEPAQWTVHQASDKSGAAGPNAFDFGEEWGLAANRKGIFAFDGGSPTPISRELQSNIIQSSIWEAINWNAGQKIWVRNDLTNRRFFVGVPMSTPNFWLPDAPILSNPTSPNVILMCNYSGCPTYEELVASSPVHTTMFGDLKPLDMRRKWSIWQIPSPVAEAVTRADGISDPLFFCNGIQSSKIYQLIPGGTVGQQEVTYVNIGGHQIPILSGAQNTDDGAAIPFRYCTYAFTGVKQGQQIPGLGALRKVWYYLAATMEGVGQVAATLYINTLGATYPYTIPLPFTLTYPAQDDQERVLEIGGQKLFVEFTSVGTGGYAEISMLMLDGEMDKWSSHRGVSS